MEGSPPLLCIAAETRVLYLTPQSFGTALNCAVDCLSVCLTGGSAARLLHTDPVYNFIDSAAALSQAVPGLGEVAKESVPPCMSIADQFWWRGGVTSKKEKAECQNNMEEQEYH